jgi:hypothetical protein
MKKKGPRNYEYKECYSAEWLRYEARETQKDHVFFCVFLCVRTYMGS